MQTTIKRTTKTTKTAINTPVVDLHTRFTLGNPPATAVFGRKSRFRAHNHAHARAVVRQAS
jgi:hypothetical protein